MVVTYKIGPRQVFCTKKAQIAVNRVIEKLRQGRKRRDLITRESEGNLLSLSYKHPVFTRLFLKGLLGLDSPVEGIVVPQSVAEIQNRDVLRQLGEHSFLFELTGETGMVDLRRANLKRDLGYVDLTPHHKPKTLEDYREILDKSCKEFEKDAELGNLFLFKGLLRARIDLYIAGEERSALKSIGQQVRMTRKLERVKDFLDYLLKKFPFGGSSERGVVKERVIKASRALSRLNNPAADMALEKRTAYLGKVLKQQIREKMRESLKKNLKVKYQGKGVWTIIKTGHKKSKTGLIRKEEERIETNTTKILSLLQHEIDSIDAEMEKNKKYLDDLESIREHFPGFWDMLYEISLDFRNYFSLIKEKAQAEMEGALELARIRGGTEQPLRLARDLLDLAERDLRLRQKELQAQKKRIAELIPETEEKIGAELREIALSISRNLGHSQVLIEASVLSRVRGRLGGVLRTFFQEKMREKWLGRAHSKVTGLTKHMPKIQGLLQQKLKLANSVPELRKAYERRKNKIIRSRKSLGEKKGQLNNLKDEFLGKVRRILASIEQLNKKIVDELVKGIATLLRIELEFLNRHETTICEEEFFKGYLPLLRGVETLNVDYVEITSKNKGKEDGEYLGKALRNDAALMGFKDSQIRELRA